MNPLEAELGAHQGNDLGQAQLDLFGRANSQMLEYWLADKRWARFTLPPVHAPELAHVMQEDLRTYRRLGVECITTYCGTVNEAYLDKYRSFSAFIYPKLAWDPDADIDAWLARYCAAVGVTPEEQNQLEAYSRAVLLRANHKTPITEPVPPGVDGAGLEEFRQRYAP